MKNNTSLSVVVVLILALIGYFAFFSGEKKKKKVESKKLSLLLSGENGESGDGSFEKKRGQRNSNSSLWEGDFMKSGVVYTEEETNSTTGDKGEIPINPQTGKPWEEDAMQQFDELRKIFADNDLIPRRTTKEEREKQKIIEEKWNKAQTAVSSGKFTRDDLETHFSHQKKVVEDRLQIIEYLIESQKEDGEVDKDGQFQKILDGTKEQMKQLETQKEELSKRVSG